MYQSRRTGPVTTTVRVHPLATLFVAACLAIAGVAMILTLNISGVIVGGAAVWLAVGMVRTAGRQILRAIEVWRS